MAAGKAILVLTLVATLWAQVSAQTGCTAVIVSLAPCLSYITANSSTAPSSSCCSQLASVVQNQAPCLCTVLNGSAAAALGLTINTTQALTLPGACNVQTPPVSRCNAAAGPAESPNAAPASPSSPGSSTPATPGTPAGPSGASGNNGSKTVPSTGQASDASSSKSTYSMMLSVIFLAACMTKFAGL